MIEREMYKLKKKPKKESPALKFMREMREEEYERTKNVMYRGKNNHNK